MIFSLHMFLKCMLAPFAYGAIGAIFDDHGKVLLVRHGYQPGWHLPGGGVNRGEAGADAVMRELSEEIGLKGGSVKLFSIYTRKAGWVTNVIALYRVSGGRINFQPNWEIREICFADPLSPPPGSTQATIQRLKELVGVATPSQYW